MRREEEDEPRSQVQKNAEVIRQPKPEYLNYPSAPVEHKLENIEYPGMADDRHDYDQMSPELRQQSFNDKTLDSFQILSQLRSDTKKYGSRFIAGLDILERFLMSRLQSWSMYPMEVGLLASNRSIIQTDHYRRDNIFVD